MGLNIPQLPELTFEEDSHTYRLDGLIIPSVTTLMKPLSEAYYGGIDAKVLGKAADRGSAVHSAIDLYSKYGVIDIEPELEGYFEAFRAWAKDFEVKPYATETRTYNRSLLYAGTVDMTYPIDQGTELDISFEYEESDGWLHLCELREKASGDLLAMLHGYGIDSVPNLADTIEDICNGRPHG